MVYYVATSLDGFIATEDGGIDWLSAFESAGEDYGYAEFYKSVDCLLMGGRTYQQVLEFGEWPYSGKPCWVFSRRPKLVSHTDVTITSKTPGEVAYELQARNFEHAWLIGGGELAASFRAEGLITEYIITVIPIILGTGIPLFGASGSQEILRLMNTQQFKNGLVQLRYSSNRSGPVE
ncbi:MAG: dihydrofolate reductase [candidate division Zixibacteria bacterium]|nr:dihydrofolate reductase [candidate division KSB1 bacterium]NIR64299.1 dihydrofolate reductase [candidate division Zixibacteria bacterium]NIW45166.1 dihydrofolate reductase [Gammaproteobacteria bacterium]NIS46202.1 dihydrofolate reductase [candidate division Zixibacteria bacterium]NIT71452.1 dihydrofolate reductase [candidate division KSB1 bacterium]